MKRNWRLEWTTKRLTAISLSPTGEAFFIYTPFFFYIMKGFFLQWVVITGGFPRDVFFFYVVFVFLFYLIFFCWSPAPSLLLSCWMLRSVSWTNWTDVKNVYLYIKHFCDIFFFYFLSVLVGPECYFVFCLLPKREDYNRSVSDCSC